MMRSLYSGITGLRNHQTRMDVIGNNIANVNTDAFKASRALFQDIYSQTIQAASGGIVDTSATPNVSLVGGTNPRQIGLGVSLSTIQTNFTGAPPRYTGAPLDLMIDGDGFFVVKKGDTVTYTRAGAFELDKAQNLTAPDGSIVQGYLYKLTVDGNGVVTGNDMTGGALVFNHPPDTTTGKWKDTDLENIVLDEQFYNVNIDKDGVITALTKNGDTLVYLGVVAVATFANDNGLTKIGGNKYQKTINSGEPTFVQPGKLGSGTLNPGSVEMSNVDLATEFTDMIVTQRGFQANSRTITTSDSMLEELVNLKR